MLQLSELQLKQNIVIISQHLVEVEETSKGGIQKAQDIIDAERMARKNRTGVVVAHGKLTDDVLEELSLIVPLKAISHKDTTGTVDKLEQLKEEYRNTALIGKIVLFEVHGADPFDLPICYNELDTIGNTVPVSRALRTHAHYLLGIINPQEETMFPKIK